jgi:hypothetical protein
MLGVLKKDGKKDEESKSLLYAPGEWDQFSHQLLRFKRQRWEPLQEHGKVDRLARGELLTDALIHADYSSYLT